MFKTQLSDFRLRKLLFFVAVLAPAACLVLAGAGEASPVPKTYTDETSVLMVEIPVYVSKKGEPVRGLQKDNFRVFDRGEEQEIVGFEEIDLTSTKVGAVDLLKAVPSAARRHVLMLFDLSFSRPEKIARARDAARDMLKSFHPTDVVGVATYSPAYGTQILASPSADRAQVEHAITHLAAPHLIESPVDPLRFFFGDLLLDSIAPNQPVTGAADGSGYSYHEWTQEVLYIFRENDHAQKTDRVKAFTEDLGRLADALAGVDGAKHVVLFSEGIDNQLLLGDGGTQLDTRRSVEEGRFFNVQGNDNFGITEVQNALSYMVEAFHRADCRVHTVDVAGVRAAANEMGSRAGGEDSLVSIANDTGGEYLRNYNQLGTAMAEILERTSVTYLLAIQPGDIATDGRYRHLDVRLKNTPRGLSLSHRPGYYSPDAEPKKDARAALMSNQLTLAEQLLASREGGPFQIDVFAAPYPVRGEHSYVPLLLEIDGTTLLESVASLESADSSAQGETELELYVYAFDHQGRVGDFFAQKMTFDLAAVGDQLRTSGVKHWGHLDLPPGDYTARILLRDHGGKLSTLRLHEITVPEPGAGAQLLPPLIPESPGAWLLTREPPGRQRSVSYPFMAGDRPFIPAARPRVPSAGETALYLEARNLDGDARFEARVLGADGRPVEVDRARFAVEEKQENAAASMAHRVAGHLVTRGLTPGEYTLVATVRDAIGESRSSSIPFSVER